MKKTLLFYSLAIVTAATAMAGLRHTQKAPAALDAKLEALTAKPHSPSLREIGSESPPTSPNKSSRLRKARKTPTSRFQSLKEQAMCCLMTCN